MSDENEEEERDEGMIIPLIKVVVAMNTLPILYIIHPYNYVSLLTMYSTFIDAVRCPIKQNTFDICRYIPT